MAKRILLKCGWLVSADPTIGELKDAEILVEGDRITAVGKSLSAQADETIDASHMIAMPGLVNAHAHIWQTALRGVGSEWVSAEYHRNMHGNMATRYGAEDLYLGTLAGALAQINCGVTTVLEWSHAIRDLQMAERALDGLEESQIRGVFAHGTAKPPTREGELPFGKVPHPRARVEALRKNRLPGDDGLVRLAMAILGPDMGSFEVFEKDLLLARELGLMSSAHVWWGYNRILPDETVKDGYVRMARKGLLGPDHNVAHGNYLDDLHLKVLVDHGVSITPTVQVEAHGHGVQPLTGRVCDLGALPSLGIDSTVFVSDDMFLEMRAALLLLRYRDNTANHAKGNAPLPRISVKSRQALDWVTVGGARALCMEDKIGSLTPGKKADIILLGATDPGHFPVHDPLHTVVEQATGANVRDVMIGGEFRKRDGKLLYPEAKMRTLQTRLADSAARVMRDAGYVHRAL